MRLCAFAPSACTNNLSKDALKHLSRNNSKGFLINPEIKRNLNAETIRAIDRKKFGAIFREIYKINKKFKAKKGTPPISVQIITKGAYSEYCVKNIFNRLYGNILRDGNIIHKNLFTALGIEFYNRSDLKKTANVKIPSETTSSGYLSLEKSRLMSALFNDFWIKKWPGLEKSQVYLIDNDDANTEGAKQQGFNALHWPTTPHTSKGKEFAQEREVVLKKINNLVAACKYSKADGVD